MKDGTIAWMARHPVAANLTMLGLFFGGLWVATTHIQQEVEPNYELDVIEVQVGYPGAAPKEVETGILLPIEEALRSLQGIREMTSQAREGKGTVNIELVVGTDPMRAYQEVEQAVSRIRTFPEDSEEPEVQLISEQQEVMEVGIYGAVDTWTLRKQAELLRDRLLNEPEITQVELSRVPEYVTHVEIPHQTLRKHGLSLRDIADAIANASRDVPAGAVETTAGEVLLRLHERKQWAKEFANIAVLSSAEGATITLGELAEITDGFAESGFHAQFNRQPSVELEIYRLGNQSPLAIAAATARVLEEYQRSLPPHVHVRIDNNAADDYEDRLSLLTENGLLAALIVLGILALFLEVRLAFWVMVGMVVAFIGGIAFLPPLGVSINMVSMFGFLVVLGIVVDDAVVIGENIYEHQQHDPDPMAAAIRGTREVSHPVVFSILTNVVAFIPLLFMPGTTGKYWWHMPAVVIVVLVVSLFEAMYILPAHLGHRAKQVSGIERWFAKGQTRIATGLNRAIHRYYGPVLRHCLRHRHVTLCSAIAVLTVIGVYGHSDHMGLIMMPEVAANEIEAGVSLPVGTTPLQAAAVAAEVTEATHQVFETYHLERVAEGIKTNVRHENFIDVEIVLKPPNERTMSASQVIDLWRAAIGDIDGVDQITFEAERGPGGHRQDVEVDLSHSNIEVLEQASQIFIERVKSFQVTRDVSDNYDAGKAQLDFTLLPEASSLGLTPEDVGQQVRDGFFGALALRQLRGTEEIEVRVKLPRSERDDLHAFHNFVLRTPTGADVPLLDVVEVTPSQSFTTITRRSGRRVVTVSLNVDPKSAINQVLDALQNVELPQLQADFPGLTWSFEGSQAEMRQATQSLWSGFGIAMGLIYSLLAVAFRSYLQPLVVMGAIPFGVIGAIIGHIILGYDLSLVSLMGIIALSGVVVNDSLVMVDFANRKRDELGAREAIHQAGLRRFRPIMLTTLTTFGGLTPIIAETSSQARHLIPMAISLGFGIVFATAVVLLVVPSLYLLVTQESSDPGHP